VNAAAEAECDRLFADVVSPEAPCLQAAAPLIAWLRAEAIEWRRSEGIPGFPHAAKVADFYAGLGDEIADALTPEAA
jgi:hypothetical protein